MYNITMKLTEEQIKEIENSYGVAIFEKRPEIGDTFKIGDVVFEARKETFKLIVV
jgi:hypothetical protein